MFSDESLENLRLSFLPAALDVLGAHLAIFVAAAIGGSVELGLDGRPFLAHTGDEVEKNLLFLFRPRSALEGMQLAKPVSIHTLHSSMWKALRNFHPRAFEFCLVVALGAKAGSRDLLNGAEFFDSAAHSFRFFLGEFPPRARTRLTITVLGPLVVGRQGTAGVGVVKVLFSNHLRQVSLRNSTCGNLHVDSACSVYGTGDKGESISDSAPSSPFRFCLYRPARFTFALLSTDHSCCARIDGSSSNYYTRQGSIE